jgi:hypothetical protein
MTGAALLSQLRARGAHVEVIAGRLRVHPRSRIHDLEALLQAHRMAVVEALEAEARCSRGSEEYEVSEERAPTVSDPALSSLSSLLRDAYASLDTTDRGRLEAEAAEGNALAGTVLHLTATDMDGEPIAWKLYSHRLGVELWVARDLRALAELEHDHALGDLPVVLGDELGDLAGLDIDTVRALLAAKVSFGPTTRVTHLPPDEDRWS